MAAGEEGGGGGGNKSNFSIIVKESKDHAIKQDENLSSSAAVKYAKSTHSVGSVDMAGEVKGSGVTEPDSARSGGSTRDTSVDPPSTAAIRYAKSTSSFGSRDSKMEGITCQVQSAGTTHRENTRDDQTSSSRHKGKKSSRVGVEHPAAALERGVLGPSQDSTITVKKKSSEKKDKKFKHRHHRLWYRLRRRHLHMGVVEVNDQHPFYDRLQAISAGFQSIMDDTEKFGPLDNLEAHHYSRVIRKEVKIQLGSSAKHQKTFLFESYAPSVFATIRRAVSVEEDSFMESIISRQNAYLEFISNSRSGQDFFLSYDTRYLIKTNKENDVQFLLNILREYLQHFQSYPHSLLVKYLGCYSIKFSGKKKVYFLVMQNIFYPADRIEDRFDIKGCTSGRYQEPDPPGSRTIIVLKDQNFFQEDIQLGKDREWFINQLTADSTFLQSMNVMDYSLLIGRQKLHVSERNRQSLPELISRIHKSAVPKLSLDVDSTQASVCSDSILTSRTEQDLDPYLDTSYTHPNHVPSPRNLPSESGVTPFTVDMERISSLQQKNGLHFPHSLTDKEDSRQVEGELGGSHSVKGRRRLLPDTPNPLHIVDGPEFRYFLGVVDFLTRWTLRQKMARLWKVVKYGCGEHSTMPPPYYSQRFLTFISARVS